MQHPFDLKISDLESQLSEQDLVEEIGNDEANSISGGLTIYTTEAYGEEGGFKPYPLPLPKPIPCPKPKPIHPPIVTTKAWGEEGGGECFPIRPIKPPIATTLALGEEGGGECFPTH